MYVCNKYVFITQSVCLYCIFTNEVVNQLTDIGMHHFNCRLVSPPKWKSTAASRGANRSINTYRSIEALFDALS